LGVSTKDLFSEGIFLLFTSQKEKITRGMKQRFLDEKTRKNQHQLHLIHNWYKRIVLHVYPDYNLHGFTNHNKVKSMIAEMKEHYVLLDEENQELLKKEYKHLCELGKERVFDSWVENKLSDEAKKFRRLK